MAMTNMVRLTLLTDPETTCKERWHFMLQPTEDGDYVIVELEATGRQGCEGHPKTIAALLCGQRIRGIDLARLDDTPCHRHASCGQTLANLIRELKRNLSVG